MKNDEQLPPHSQPYQGWTYHQEQQLGHSPAESQSSSLPPHTTTPSIQQPARPTVEPSSASPLDHIQDSGAQFSDTSYDPDLTMDMGRSLGYSQSIQYHAISMPQPTQSMPKLHQTRLQQLHEERMRRQQQRMNPDTTTLMRRKRQSGSPENQAMFPASMQSKGPGGTSEEVPTGSFAAAPHSRY